MSEAPAEQMPSIRLILDASAIAAFGGNETVGQIIGDVQDEGECFAVPTACLAEALALGPDPDLVQLLQSHAGYVSVTSTADWASLGRFMDLTRPGPAHVHDVTDSDVAILAVRTEAYILTDQPSRYSGIYSGVPTILLQKPWVD